nr:MAG TPA: hypothetical protein [Caudoviricetes sp.]
MHKISYLPYRICYHLSMSLQSCICLVKEISNRRSQSFSDHYLHIFSSCSHLSLPLSKRQSDLSGSLKLLLSI